jgi:hypothetical protein
MVCKKLGGAEKDTFECLDWNRLFWGDPIFSAGDLLFRPERRENGKKRRTSQTWHE